MIRIGWKLPLVLAALAGVGTWLTVDQKSWHRAIEIWNQVSGSALHAGEIRPSKDWTTSPGADTSNSSLNLLTLTSDQIEAIGLKTVPVREQTEPIILRLAGVTDYDPATLSVVRSQLDCRVDKVLVDQGSVVKKGDPLLEVFSNDLADGKSNYETTRSQWIRDKRVFDYKSPLAKSGSLPAKELIEIENDLAKSELQMKLAKDKLLVYGLTEKEIDNAKNEDGVQKAMMILRSRADGIVIKRSVVQGTYYDSKDELMQIAPLDHLWVRGSVSELDADKVEVGQKIRIVFPYTDKTIDDQVEYIDKAIDPETRAAKFRASIPNPGKKFKAGMFVRVLLEIPPKPGRTIIPRSSMVSVDRLGFVFLKLLNTNRFERRHVFVSKESSDWVIVAEPSPEHLGLKPGELVVTNGSLILEQMYEDRLTTEGETSKERPMDDEAFGKPDKPVSITIH
jgi:cobalt-zinc-cadmium efflux system membrane fusion protein